MLECYLLDDLLVQECSFYTNTAEVEDYCLRISVVICLLYNKVFVEARNLIMTMATGTFYGVFVAIIFYGRVYVG